jgi:hypothetical protein
MPPERITALQSIVPTIFTPQAVVAATCTVPVVPPSLTVTLPLPETARVGSGIDRVLGGALHDRAEAALPLGRAPGTRS